MCAEHESERTVVDGQQGSQWHAPCLHLLGVPLKNLHPKRMVSSASETELRSCFLCAVVVQLVDLNEPWPQQDRIDHSEGDCLEPLGHNQRHI